MLIYGNTPKEIRAMIWRRRYKFILAFAVIVAVVVLTGCGTAENKKIELTAELFSVDGISRFFIKEDDDIENHMILAKKIAGDLKIKSKGSYKG